MWFVIYTNTNNNNNINNTHVLLQVNELADLLESMGIHLVPYDNDSDTDIIEEDEETDTSSEEYQLVNHITPPPSPEDWHYTNVSEVIFFFMCVWFVLFAK